MGQRREPRKEVRLPVRIFGTDANGRTFSENVFTSDVSQGGVKLDGVQAEIKVGEIIGMAYGQNKGRFSVKWAGQAGSSRGGQLGLQILSSNKPLWDFSLPASEVDGYKAQARAAERRKHPRLKAMNSVELHPEGQAAPIWGRAIDLSLGGCFIEMPIPLKQGMKLKVGIWIRETKLWAVGKIVNSRPGFGVGIQFTEISEEDSARLKQFLQSITSLPGHPAAPR